jgi:cytidylate kinase
MPESAARNAILIPKLTTMGHVIAIDGPAGAGKSTIARMLAEKLGFTYVDTGAMYRAVALWASRTGNRPSDAHKLEQLARSAKIDLLPHGRVRLNGEDVTEAIRAPEISALASQVASIGVVRAAMVAKQRELAENSSVVMEGRDIGSVVFPDARVKIFLDADPSERVRRRSGDLPDQHPEALATQIAERDQRDRNRVESPLLQAPDAIYLDSTGMTPQQVEEAILGIVRAKLSNGSSRAG